MPETVAYDPLGAPGTCESLPGKVRGLWAANPLRALLCAAASGRDPQFLPRSAGHQPQRFD